MALAPGTRLGPSWRSIGSTPVLRAFLTAMLLAIGATHPAAAEPPRDVDIGTADDGQLKATYYAAAGRAPAVLLLHMCTADRGSWQSTGQQLSDAGLHALAIDYRGFGESLGPRFHTLPGLERRAALNATWPRDVDAALRYLSSQPGVDSTRLGVLGADCGVHQAVLAARRHPEVVSLALLSGTPGPVGRLFLRETPWLPLFAAAAADDPVIPEAPATMRWLIEVSGNPRSALVSYPDGGHGTELFGTHPELLQALVDWFTDTLMKRPANPAEPLTRHETPSSVFGAALDQPDGVSRAVEIFERARQQSPVPFLFTEYVMNQLAYERLLAGQTTEALHLFKMMVEAYPTSANAHDSLGDGYYQNRQEDLALAAARKALELLPGDSSSEAAKNGIRRSAERKIQAVPVIDARAGADFCCPDYLTALQQLVRRNWNGYQAARGETELKIVVRRDGHITDVSLERSSGVSSLDQSAERALRLTKNVSSLPVSYTGPQLIVRLAFQPALLRASDDIPGLVLPRIVQHVRPGYRRDAMERGIEGTVLIEAVVLVDGTVGQTRVIRALDVGLDEEAVKAAKRWRFTPATKDGAPVPVLVTIEVTFSLRR